mmetsp:Transcript_34567/g.55717  ORF Transcript_34567/g.55717 Transcript_34567/m.55717 type:complete len:111 (-) Transcript_34567:345-677(-)
MLKLAHGMCGSMPHYSSPPSSYSELTAIDNDDLLAWGTGPTADALDLIDDIGTLKNLSKNDMTTVEPRGLNSCNEKLTAVRIRPSVGHGEEVRSGVLQIEVLVLELGSVD